MGGLRQRLVFLVGLLALVAVGVWLVAANDDAPDDAAPDTDVDDEPDDREPVESDDAETEAIDAAGRLDGQDSLRLPITAVPDTDLVDLQMITVSGSGFTPGATIAMVQCWLAEDGGTVDDCDLGNIGVAFADPQGFFAEEMRVHRVIDTINGVRDCGQGSADEGCRIGVGNTENLDESGGVALAFAVDAAAPAPPSITVSPAVGLVDGDTITVTGSGFPDVPIIVTQCPVGGQNDASSGCVNRNPGQEVVASIDGTFSIDVAAERITRSVDGDHDCALEVHGCMLVVRSGDRSPNPVPLVYDAGAAPPLPPEYTLSPSDGLVNGSVVRLDVYDMPADGAFTVSQCADGGPRGLFCAELGTIEVAGGTGGVDVVVEQILSLGDDEIDCGPPERVCYLELDGELTGLVRGPLRFAS